jgi:hypothetical protein
MDTTKKPEDIDRHRRRFFGTAAMTIAAAGSGAASRGRGLQPRTRAASESARRVLRPGCEELADGRGTNNLGCHDEKRGPSPINAAVERREANVPIARDVRHFRKCLDVPIARHAKGASQAPERLSALYSPSLGREGFLKYGATGAAKYTDGEALALFKTGNEIDR